MREPPKECVILGAGFSFGFSDDAPLMKDFFERAQKKVEKQETLEKVLNRVRGFFPNTENPNLEDAASFLFMRRSTGATKRNDDLYFRRLVRVISAVLADVHLHPRSVEIENSYRDFFAALLTERTPIVSFNYDLIAERFLVESSSWDGVDGYGVQMDVIGAKMDVIGAKGTDQQRFWGGNGNSKLALFKLHGSINWGVRNFPNADGTRPIEVGFKLSKSVKPIPVEDIEVARETLYGATAEWEPFIVPPVAVKSGFLSAGPLENIWYQAQHVMSCCERMFLIGYSCPQTDTHVDALIRESLFSEPKEKKVFIVNPSEEDFVRFKQKYHGSNLISLKHIKMNAQEYAARCSDKRRLYVE